VLEPLCTKFRTLRRQLADQLVELTVVGIGPGVDPQHRGHRARLHISATHFVGPFISPTGGAIVLAIAVTWPDSIGTVGLRSPDPKDGLAINYNFLAEPRDRRRRHVS